MFAFNGNRPIDIKQKPIWLWAGLLHRMRSTIMNVAIHDVDLSYS